MRFSKVTKVAKIDQNVKVNGGMPKIDTSMDKCPLIITMALLYAIAHCSAGPAGPIAAPRHALPKFFFLTL